MHSMDTHCDFQPVKVSGGLMMTFLWHSATRLLLRPPGTRKSGLMLISESDLMKLRNLTVKVGREVLILMMLSGFLRSGFWVFTSREVPDALWLGCQETEHSKVWLQTICKRGPIFCELGLIFSYLDQSTGPGTSLWQSMSRYVQPVKAAQQLMKRPTLLLAISNILLLKTSMLFNDYSMGIAHVGSGCHGIQQLKLISITVWWWRPIKLPPLNKMNLLRTCN